MSVFYKLNSAIERGTKARRIGLEPVPLNQHIEGGYGGTRAAPENTPSPDASPSSNGQTSVKHREHRLHQHPVLPLSARTQFQVAGIPSAAWKPVSLRQSSAHQPAESAIERCCPRHWRWHTPTHDQPPLIEQQTKFAPDNPAVIREAFATNLLGTPAFAHGVNQLDAVGVNDPSTVGAAKKTCVQS